ncbi:MAG: L-seryl-tRNA(Sec) selenium transferase [Bacteroidia bacterium]|nr:L-seryl-tRNA(Sec) selenium transferase [Bacteroidia bacterium]
MKEFKQIPSVDKLLNLSEVKNLIQKYGIDVVTYSIRNVLNDFRNKIKDGQNAPATDIILTQVEKEINKTTEGSLKPVINCTGVIIHTNLGRAPFGKEMVTNVFDLLCGYSNIEFSLENGVRSDRNIHASNLLKYLTGAEDVLVVNNNAAAVILILNSLAKGKEVIISRGELIEIGGSFRMPEIMKTSGAKMVEVGSTNKTRLSDYENSINKNTALLFKAHKSNYSIKGFTEDVELKELVNLGEKYRIPVIFDMGSGLLKKIDNTALMSEPDVKQALATGADLACFSGDKLLGGPQAGIIAGKKEFVGKLKREPMMRALRVCKLTLIFLENTCKYYLNQKLLIKNNMIYKTLNKTEMELKSSALMLQEKLKKFNIRSTVVQSHGQYGGGAMPEHTLKSFSVVINEKFGSRKNNSSFAENMYRKLLILNRPILGILKKGEIHFDILTISNEDIPYIAEMIDIVFKKVTQK